MRALHNVVSMNINNQYFKYENGRTTNNLLLRTHFGFGAGRKNILY